jgi:hypothetical protein
MNIKKIIQRSVGKISNAVNNLKSCMSSKRRKKARSARIKLPPTNPDWHNDTEAKSLVHDPDHFIIALEPKGGDGGQRSWVDEVYDALNEVCQAILDGDDIPMELFDSESGEIIGEVVIIDTHPEDVDWDGALKMMKAKSEESESG